MERKRKRKRGRSNFFVASIVQDLDLVDQATKKSDAPLSPFLLNMSHLALKSPYPHISV
jgi:hypothetical protein